MRSAKLTRRGRSESCESIILKDKFVAKSKGYLNSKNNLAPLLLFLPQPFICFNITFSVQSSSSQ